MAIAITGMGTISPLGNSAKASWEALCRGTNGIDTITCFDTNGFSFTQAGEVKELEQLQESNPLPADSRDRATELLWQAVSEATKQAKIGADDDSLHNAALIGGTNFGASRPMERVFQQACDGKPISAIDFDQSQFRTSVDMVAAAIGFDGTTEVISLSCASGTAVFATACDLIRTGNADVVIAAGYDALSRFAWSGLCSLRTMTKDYIRPFDHARNGTIFSEGATAFVLESTEHAAKRNVKPLAHVLGAATNNNAFHMTAPVKNGAGSAAVMQAALKDAELTAADIDHINLHGTATKLNDITETQAIRSVFGARADYTPTTAIKSMCGHMMGAAGAFEAFATVMTLRHHLIPPTINHQQQDDQCNLNVVFKKAKHAVLRAALSNSAGIGGCNAAVILGKA